MVLIPAKFVIVPVPHVLELQLLPASLAMMDTYLNRPHVNLDALRVNSYQVVNVVLVVTTARYVSIVHNAQLVHLDYWFQQMVDVLKNALTERFLLMDHARNAIQLARNVMMHQLVRVQHVLLDS